MGPAYDRAENACRSHDSIVSIREIWWQKVVGRKRKKEPPKNGFRREALSGRIVGKDHRSRDLAYSTGLLIPLVVKILLQHHVDDLIDPIRQLVFAFRRCNPWVLSSTVK